MPQSGDKLVVCNDKVEFRLVNRVSLIFNEIILDPGDSSQEIVATGQYPTRRILTCEHAWITCVEKRLCDPRPTEYEHGY